MSSAASAYTRTAQATVPPRELEAHLLMKAATRLQVVKEDWSRAQTELSPSLVYNRKLWTIFATSVTAPESSLPVPVRENVANLAVFVFKRTMEIESAPAPEKLAALIEINRNLAAGLRGRA